VPDARGAEEFELAASGPRALDERTDVVAFGSPPPFAFLPFFRVRGFAAGICSNFLAIGI
jgi:hypothetical protein